MKIVHDFTPFRKEVIQLVIAHILIASVVFLAGAAIFLLLTGF